MRKILPLLAMAVIAVTMATGCANAERKLGRGLTNVAEPLRMGELRRTMEQEVIFSRPSVTYASAFVTGFNRTMARTGIGIYEIVTAPFPPYGPVATGYLSPNPVYPDNYTPNIIEDSTFATDVNVGFSGGDVAPGIPGSRFRIFDTH
jgi:putative exosortase-associated protein (TIGR04073 family)